MPVLANSSWRPSHGREPFRSQQIVSVTNILNCRLSDNPPNADAPDVKYDLEYVYGYRCADSRQNVYLNDDGNAVYMTAALGVILDIGSNTQKFFGGGQVENTSKQTANDNNSHTNDIMAISISDDRKTMCSGQVGSSPVGFTWCPSAGTKIQRFKLKKGARGVNAISMSNDSKYVCCVDLSNDHNVLIFEAANGNLAWSNKGDTNKIFDCAWSQKAGDYTVCTAGSKHLKFWQPFAEGKKERKGIYGQAGSQTSHACCTWDDQGIAYSGGCNAQIYVWDGQNLKSTHGIHKSGFICTIRWSGGKLMSGGKDGQVIITDTATMTATHAHDFGGLVRAVDHHNGKAVVGLRSGQIYEWDMAEGKKVIMESHNEGEVWGVCSIDDNQIGTSADDNQVKIWDISKRQCVQTGIVSTRQAKSKKGGASTLSNLPASQCSRALAYNPNSGDIAVAHNDGAVSIRSASDVGSIKKELTESDEWIEVMEYSPDGTKLAVGSHDNNIYIYDANSYDLIGTCKAHKSFITAVDWAKDSSFIRSVCGAYELLFFKGDDFSQDPSGATNTKDTDWATGHVKFSWHVNGIFPSGEDGSHINYVDISKDGNLIAAGDDFGLVQIFRNPCLFGHKPVSLRGHSEHVVKVMFHSNDTYLISIGGYDQTVMQWKKA